MVTFSGRRLRAARRSAGVRPERLALDVAKSVDTIRAYEAGKVDPPASVVAKLAQALNLHPGELFESDGEQAAA